MDGLAHHSMLELVGSWLCRQGVLAQLLSDSVHKILLLHDSQTDNSSISFWNSPIILRCPSKNNSIYLQLDFIDLY